ncbi:mismatch repair endonuclease PMS2 isoform X2 [Phymastichus coffea]|uniref:mismatch repair endonuclease PMS2 isoform X2 n=1 Tax=Phymastichus coffea TaxID=108790 RepID=UPI00273ADD38|nr:mismatch repair endonuclease PMS2 isoform X2 [Phymastichus coffea]
MSTETRISAIDKKSVHRICSGQVVLDLAIAVKELVENSIDSGATSIEIKLIDYGKTCITVIDNGSGVLETDFEGLGLKHHTSKLREFSDLLEVETFGFRGEALSSLCSLSKLNIVTRHFTSQYAFDLYFDKNGILTKKKECARQQGTTVHVRDIFKNLPVRANEFERNIKKEFAKMIQVLYSYCLVSTGIKIVCTNSLGNKSPNVVVATNGVNNVLDNITSVFGRKARKNLIEVPMQLPNEEILEEYNLSKDVLINFTWTCFVSSSNHTLGRSSPDRQFFYVNGRPCDPTKINKLINHTYHKYNNKQYPFVFLNIQLDQSCADVNVTPDKRTILFTEEQLLLATIKFSFDKAWYDIQGTFTVKTLDQLNLQSYKRSIPDSIEYHPPMKKPHIENLKHKPNINKDSCSVLESIKTKLNLNHNEKSTVTKGTNAQVVLIKDKINNYQFKQNYSHQEENGRDLKYEAKNDTNIYNDLEYREELNIKNEQTEIFKNQNDKHIDNKIILKTKLPDVEMIINFEIIKKKLKESKEIQHSKQILENRVKYKSHLNSKTCDIEKELENELKTGSFEKMHIIGQFNLGFILTKLDNDIFIIDQHASDEKYRFEKLSNETKLKTQKLIIPKPLNFATLNESILIENQYIFESNGFTFNINQNGDPGHKISLTGMPVSFGWQFGQEDIEELIFLIREGGNDGTGSNIIPRPSRVQQMLASRACRGAVMIGKALNLNDMNRLLMQMGQMKNPWNCPHGRPTLRHLIVQ